MTAQEVLNLKKGALIYRVEEYPTDFEGLDYNVVEYVYVGAGVGREQLTNNSASVSVKRNRYRGKIVATRGVPKRVHPHELIAHFELSPAMAVVCHFSFMEKEAAAVRARSNRLALDATVYAKWQKDWKGEVK